MKEPASIATVGETRIFKPLAWLYRWREKIQFAIDQSFSQETAGVLDAAVLEIDTTFQRVRPTDFAKVGHFTYWLLADSISPSSAGLSFWLRGD